MRLILAKRLSNDSGSYFILGFTSYSYTGTHGHSSSSLRQGQLHTHTHTTHDTRHTGPRASSMQPGRRAWERKGVRTGLLQRVASAQSLGSASLRGVLASPRTLSGGHRERARGLALSRPTPLSSPSGLRLRLGDLALLSPPQNAPSSGARAQRRAAGREGRAGVRPCVRLRQRARRRESERGKGGSGPGGSASCGYVAELGGSGSSFAAIAAT